MWKAFATSLAFVRSTVATSEATPKGQDFQALACPLQCGPDAEIDILYRTMSSSDAISFKGGVATDLAILKDGDMAAYCYPNVLAEYLQKVESVDLIWESQKISKKDMVRFLGRRELVPNDLERMVQAAQKIISSPFSKYSKALERGTGRSASAAAEASRKLAYVSASSICFSPSGKIEPVADSELQELRSSGIKISQFRKYASKENKAVQKAFGKLTKVIKSGPLAKLTLLMSLKKEVRDYISACTLSQLVAQLLTQVVQAWSIKEAREDRQVLFDIRAQMAIVGILGVDELVVENSGDDLMF